MNLEARNQPALKNLTINDSKKRKQPLITIIGPWLGITVKFKT